MSYVILLNFLVGWNVGDTTTFWAFDFGFFQKYIPIKAMCRKVSKYCDIFTAEDTLRIKEIKINPRTQVVFAIALKDTTLYRSVDNGDEWSVLMPSAGGYKGQKVSCICVHPISSTKAVVLVGSEDGGAFWTENDGGKWKRKSLPDNNVNVSAVAISPMTESKEYKMYAVVEKEVYVREHKVVSRWKALSRKGLPDAIISYLAPHPTDKEIVYAISKGVFRWSVGDSSWRNISSGLPSGSIRKVVVDLQNPDILYCATDTGVYKSVNGGGSWEAKNNGLTNLDVNTIELSEGVIYVGTNGGGVFKSKDGAESWVQINDGFKDWGFLPYVHQIFAIGIGKDDLRYAGGMHGVFRSKSVEEKWEECNEGLLVSFVTNEEIDVLPVYFEEWTPADSTKGVYQILREYIGEEPDIDGNSKITFLLLDIAGRTSYFDSVNQYPPVPPDTIFRNGQEMLYFDVGINFSDSIVIISELASCFQEMIHWKYDNNERYWISKGCSEYAKFLVGCQKEEITYPENNSIIYWNPNEEDAERRHSYLFLLYLYEQFGGNEFIRALIYDTLNGIESINKVLKEKGYSETFDSVFSDFALAVYLNIPDTSFYDGRYGFKNVTPKKAEPEIIYWYPHEKPYLKSAPLWSSNYWGSYEPWAVGFDSIFVFNGDTSSAFDVWLVKMKKTWDEPPAKDNVVEIMKLELDTIRNIVHYPLRPDWGDKFTTVVWVPVVQGEGPFFTRYVLADDIIPPFYAKLGIFQNPLADEYIHIYVFVNDSLYGNVGSETPVIEVIQGDSVIDTTIIEMERFLVPGNDTIEIVYRGVHKLLPYKATIVLRGEDIAGNQIDPVVEEIQVRHMRAKEGGKLEYEKISLNIPPNALKKDTYITIFKGLQRIPGVKMAPACLKERKIVGEVYNIGPSGLVLNTSGRLVFRYEGNFEPEKLGIYRAEGGRWVYVGGVVDAKEKVIYCEIERLGVYAVQFGEYHAQPGLPKKFRLREIMPNPFKVATIIRYEVPKPSPVSIKIYDLSGRIVKTLINNEFEKPGYKYVEWKGDDDYGNEVSCGVYFVKMKAREFECIRKSILLRK